MPVPQHHHVLRAQLHQRTQRSARLPLGTRLQIAAEQQKRRHPGRGLQVDGRGALRTGHREIETVPHAGHPRVAEEQRPHGPAEGGERPEGHQGVHRGGPVPQVRPGGPVEGVGAPGHDGCGQRQAQPLPVLELERGNHRQQDDGGGQRGGDDEPLAQPGQFPVVGALARVGAVLGGRGGGALAGSAGRGGCRRIRGYGGRGPLRGVARLLDCRDQIVDRDVVAVLDACLFGGEVDGGAHARHPVELLLHASRARGAGHAADGELDPRLCGRTGHRAQAARPSSS